MRGSGRLWPVDAKAPALERRVLVGVLRQQTGRVRAVLPDHRPARPAHLGYEVSQPVEILGVNRCQRLGVRLRLAPRSLILLRTAQQLGAQFRLHKLIILFEAVTGNGQAGAWVAWSAWVIAL
jgi:hypothetical protein